MRNLTSLLVGGALLAACSLHSGTYQLSAPQPTGPARVEKASRTQLPFPAGEWVELGQLKNVPMSAVNQAYVTGTKQMLRTYGLVVGGKIVETMEIRTNITTNGYPIVMDFACSQGTASWNSVYVSDTRGGQGDWSCLIARGVRYRPPGKTTSDYYDQVFAAARKYGGLSTRAAVSVTVSAGWQNDFLSVSFVHFPDREADGASLGQAQNWKPGQEGPQQRAYIERKLKEAQDFRPIVEKAVRNRL